MARIQLMKSRRKLVALVAILLGLWYLFSSPYQHAAAYHYEEPENIDRLFEEAERSSKIPQHPDKKCYDRSLNYKANINGQLYPRSLPVAYDQGVDYACLNSKATDTKIILSLNSFFGLAFDKKQCPVKNCEFTRDRRFKQYADLVLLNMELDEKDMGILPDYTRPAYQRWVFSVYESPIHTHDYSKFDGHFNLTATYREDSDFDGFYELAHGMVWKPNPSFEPDRDFASEKKRLAAGLISNCKDKSGRMEYIRELQRHVDGIDVLGRCGKEVTKRKGQGEIVDPAKDALADEYMFYLAFENSMCGRYATEKFFDILRSDVVPIVFGGGDYERFVPRSGFINALDFPVPAELAKYLDYLRRNATAYNSYFKWKQHVVFQKPVGLICSMCIQLHLETHFGIKNGSVNNLGEYWSKKDCGMPKIEQVSRFTFVAYEEVGGGFAQLAKTVRAISQIQLTVADLLVIASIVALFVLVILVILVNKSISFPYYKTERFKRLSR